MNNDPGPVKSCAVFAENIVGIKTLNEMTGGTCIITVRLLRIKYVNHKFHQIKNPQLLLRVSLVAGDGFEPTTFGL